MFGRTHAGFALVGPFDRLRTHRGERAAFSLIELLVVIAVIALLLTIMAPSLEQARDLARRTVCLSNARQTGQAALGFAAAHETALPPYRDEANSGEGPTSRRDPRDGGKAWQTHVIAWWEGRPDGGQTSPLTDNMYNLRPLLEMGYAGTAEVFYCPCQTRGRYAWTTHASWFRSHDWTDVFPAGGDRIHVTYSYLPYYADDPPFTGSSAANRYQLGRFEAQHALAMEPLHLANRPDLHDLSHREAAGWSVAYIDGSARFSVSREALELVEQYPNMGHSPKEVFQAARDSIVDP
jgi:prepilin-type N-terminal cleavage/methylation domain-containing protein